MLLILGGFKMTCYEIVITIIQFFVLSGLIYSLYLTRHEFTIRTRPYIGFTDIVKKKSKKTNELEFDVYVNNVGNLPAKNAKLYGRFTVSGEGEKPFECETKGSVFPYSKELSTWIIGVKDVDKKAILSGKKELKLNMTVDYYGVSKDLYQTSTNRTYDPKRDGWVKEEGNWV
jgi:hypothetical protein